MDGTSSTAKTTTRFHRSDEEMKKRILFLMPALPGGGAEKVLVDILGHFDFETYEVTLFLEFREGIYLADIPKEVEVLALHGENNLWFQRLHRRLTERGWYGRFHEIVYRPKFRKLLVKREFDTIVSFMEGSAVKFHSYITDKAKRNISWVHIDFEKKHWSLDFFTDKEDERAAYRKMDNIVFVSDGARDAFCKLYPLWGGVPRVIYNLIDKEEILSQAAARIAEKSRFTICMVGRLNRQKRYDRAIDAAKMLWESGRDFELWALGEGELENELKERASKARLEEVVKFKGFVKPAYPLMNVADLYLMTSESEGLPLVLCEALCLGLPIVSTDIPGPRELIKKSGAGILTDETPEAICEGVKQLMDNPLKMEECRLNALDFSATFQPDQTMKQIYGLL